MSPLGRAYLDKFYDSLGTLPEEERIDAVREIESHIVDGIRNGQAEGAILAKLGDPKKLAKAYRSTYMMQKKPRTFKEVLNMAGFYCTAGLLSVIVVPVLGSIAYGFGFSAILICLAGVLRSAGVPWINMDIAPGYTVPIEWSIPYAMVLSIIIGGIAYISWRYLKRYLNYLSERYRNMLDARIG